MKRIALVLTAVLSVGLLNGCKQKKQTEDIIVHKVEAPKPQAPIKMQEYNQVKDVKWLVKDETGQKFVDNRITVRIIRADGSICFNRSFTKAAFDDYLDNDYRRTGILEGIVFDRVEGNQVVFAGSVSHPQTDEYIPFIITVDNMGAVGITRDSDLDTNGNEENTL